MLKRAVFGLSTVIALGVQCAALAAPATAAPAAVAARGALAAPVDGPFAPATQITDRAGVLSSAGKASVQAALDSLYSKERLKLFITYVKDFSGTAPTAWADESATLAGMGRRDLLLAVATGGRQYAVSTDTDSGLSNAQLDQVAATAIEPALRASDWAAAGTGAANGYAAVLAGQPVPVPSINSAAAATGGSGSGGSSAGTVIAVIVVLLLLAGLVWFMLHRRRNRTGAGGQRAGAAAPALTMGELEAKAGHVLVSTDDAIRTSEQELGFATAQFGDAATAPFGDAMDSAKAELAAAFKLRQQLDDDIPEDEPTKRAMLEEIVQRCENANKTLDAQAAAFDELRNLEQNAPAMVSSLAAGSAERASAVAAARTTLASLTATYVAKAVSYVAGNADEAAARLTFADATVAQAQQAVAAGNMSQAAVLVQAAQAATDQASQLVDGINRRASELSDAATTLPQALAAVDAGVAEAAASGRPEVRAPAAAAQQAAAQVRATMAAGGYDPLEALRTVESVTASLDESLAGVREDQVRQQRAREAFDQTALTARSSIAAAADFINTNRGAIGSTARTRVASAHQLLSSAIALAPTDPVTALAQAQQADDLASQASQEARGDVSGFSQPAGRGLFGGSGGGSELGGLAGAMLGGILINGVLGGLGGSRTSSPRPAAPSYGGTGTRGRRSVGGRF